MYKIYGSKESGSAARCWWTAAEVGVELERIPIDFTKQEHKSEAYLKLNPNGKIPTLLDGEFVVWESMAINQYLAEKHKQELLGMGPQERAAVAQWSYWSLAHLQKALEPLYMQKWQGNLPPEQVEVAQKESAKWLGILETHLNGREFMVGSAFTVADINASSVVASGAAYLDMTPYANVSRWMEAMTKREAYTRTFAA